MSLTYKLSLWKLMDIYIPVLVEYDGLPKRLVNSHQVCFSSSHSVDEQNILMEKILFPVIVYNDSHFSIMYAQFVTGMIFSNIKKRRTSNYIIVLLMSALKSFFKLMII